SANLSCSPLLSVLGSAIRGIWSPLSDSRNISFLKVLSRTCTSTLSCWYSSYSSSQWSRILRLRESSLLSQWSCIALSLFSKPFCSSGASGLSVQAFPQPGSTFSPPSPVPLSSDGNPEQFLKSLINNAAAYQVLLPGFVCLQQAQHSYTAWAPIQSYSVCLWNLLMP